MSSTTLPLTGFRTRATSVFRDYSELTKLRVTTLIVMTAWCGYFFGAHKAGESWLSLGLLHALIGIGLVSSGTAALNEVMEHDIDGHMRRTASRPIPAGRMSLAHAMIVGLLMSLGGSFYLAIFTNPLTGLLTFLTSVVYLAAYTPLKRISPICTLVGAFPGAMPGVLGWTAARGRLEWETLILFAILFVWQFPHFFSIAWLYREDYEKGGIKMLPVVEDDGRSTARRILAYSIALIPISILPSYMGMAGKIYMVGAFVLGVAMLYFGVRLAFLKLPLAAARSKMRARHVLQATVIYLPLLFALMMVNAARS
ncbi:MAG TPA: heme o synthase [Dongiaceae bacterium]|nr:heme o synthase [Dongiaceae bacterium]